jgi:adenylate cyclase
MIFKKEYTSVYIVSAILTVFFTLLFIVEMRLDVSMIFKNLENKWHDLKFNQNIVGNYHLKEPDKRIIIVVIDDKTLNKYGWPFPRRYYATLIKNLNSYGVKVIGFDVLFLDEDKGNTQNDEIFAQALSKNKNVVLAVSLDDKGRLRLPLQKFLLSTDNFASVSSTLLIDNDGSIRRFYVFMPSIYLPDGKESLYLYKDIRKDLIYGNIPVALLGAYLYSKYRGISIEELYKKYGDSFYYINFRRANSENFFIYDTISFLDVVENKIDDNFKKRLKDAIILVGTGAQAAYDHFPTPASLHTPGVEIHAFACDNLLHKDYLIEVPFIIEAIILIISIWLPVILISKSVFEMSIYNFSFIVILMFVSVFLVSKNINFYFAPYFISNIVLYTYVIAYKSIVEDRQKRWIKNTFSQYLSPEVVDLLVKDPSKLKLGGERRDMSILFMDIAGFTSMSEKMTPEGVTNILNEYLSQLSDVILSKKGVIDKYIGDCIMAFWNAPIDVDKHRTLAVEAALSCLSTIKEINEKKKFNIGVRIGINSGEVVVGNMGSKKRFSYTVLGDNVNLASRLEGANKFFHTKIMVSDDVYKEAKEEFIFKYIGEILVVGKTLPVKVWEPYKKISEMNEKDKEFIENFENGIKYFYEKNYSFAKEFFLKAETIFGNDGLVIFYLNLIDELEKGKMEFDGVFNIRSK